MVHDEKSCPQRPVPKGERQREQWYLLYKRLFGDVSLPKDPCKYSCTGNQREWRILIMEDLNSGSRSPGSLDGSPSPSAESSNVGAPKLMAKSVRMEILDLISGSSDSLDGSPSSSAGLSNFGAPELVKKVVRMEELWSEIEHELQTQPFQNDEERERIRKELKDRIQVSIHGVNRNANPGTDAIASESDRAATGHNIAQVMDLDTTGHDVSGFQTKMQHYMASNVQVSSDMHELAGVDGTLKAISETYLAPSALPDEPPFDISSWDWKSGFTFEDAGDIPDLFPDVAFQNHLSDLNLDYNPDFTPSDRDSAMQDFTA